MKMHDFLITFVDATEPVIVNNVLNSEAARLTIPEADRDWIASVVKIESSN